MTDSENSIIQTCQQGNLEKFGELYDKYIKKIYNFVYYKTWHQETTEDITSQTFMKALERIGSFDSNRGTFQAWLYQIARNTVIDYYRTSKNSLNIDDIWRLSAGGDIEIDFNNKQLLEKVSHYLDSVKPEHKEIFIMRIWNGLSYKEIATIVGKTEANCKMIFSRILVRLQNEITLSLLFIIINFF